MLPAAAQGIIELPIGEDRGGIGVQVFAVRDHQYMTRSMSVSVPWDNKELKLAFTTLRDKAASRPKGNVARKCARAQRQRARARHGRTAGLYVRPQLGCVCAARTTICHVAVRADRAFPGRINLDSQHPQWVYSTAFGRVSVPSIHGDALSFPDGLRNWRSGSARTDGVGRMRMLGGPPENAAPAPMAAAAPAQSAAPKRPKKKERDEPTVPDTGKDKDATVARKPSAGKSGSASGSRNHAAIELCRNRVLFTAASDRSRWQRRAIEFTVPDSVTSWNVWVRTDPRSVGRK